MTLSGVASAADIDGSQLSLVWCLPFLAMLLAIALGPLIAPRAWHAHDGKVSIGLAALFLIPFAVRYGAGIAVGQLVHALVAEYIPFVVLLATLYCVSGGIHLRVDYRPSPALNVSLLATGTLMASLIGTTGAAMLMIRPVLRANAMRAHRAHVIVFFICLVANAGGALTPLGDPPLFVGFLRGVDFFWTAQTLAAPTLLLIFMLLAAFWVLDRFVFDEQHAPPPGAGEGPGLMIRSGVNLPLLAAAVGAVLMSGVWRSGVAFDIAGTPLPLENLVRDLLLATIAFISMRVTPVATRRANGYTWGPILEVARLFVGIFITIIPVIAILRAGNAGELRALVQLVEPGANGSPDATYFWLTGMLSAFLDNVPTYLVFFNLAGGDAGTLMSEHARTLLAISAGAVFMGALTYIGNAPNLMVRAIAQEAGVPMPGFFGYMAWSFAILLPALGMVTVLFFRG
jgi:Na+/H+ antiporter NhaD/arsenite permease-like protein